MRPTPTYKNFYLQENCRFNMKSFITGSHAYGQPTSESDIDLVIYVDNNTKDRLITLSDNGKMPCRFGTLNLIFATTEEEYATWLLGKISCIAQKPIKGKEAHLLHERAREQFGTTYDHDSGAK